MLHSFADFIAPVSEIDCLRESFWVRIAEKKVCLGGDEDLLLVSPFPLYLYNEGEFPTYLPLFSARMFFHHLLIVRGSLWLGRNCSFSGPSEIPPQLSEYQTYLICQACRLDCKVLIRHFGLGHGKRPWITKSSITLLAKPVDSPCAVTPRCPPWQRSGECSKLPPELFICSL